MMNLTISQLNKIWQDASTTVGGFLLADSEHPIEFHLGYDNGQRCFIVMNSGKVDDIVANDLCTSISCVPTPESIQFTVDARKNIEK